jgi:pimeloyl-ACP methyl ester carboxylesterase
MGPIATDLYVREWGAEGPWALLLHGSTSTDGATVWGDQRVLADQHRLLVPDRRGFGASPGPAFADWEDLIGDVVALLGAGAHLAGHSYGGVLGLLVAARRPDLVHSLTVVEPPAFSVARGVPEVEALVARLEPVFAPESGLTPEAFDMAFGQALVGGTPDPVTLTLHEQEQTRSVMREPVVWSAPIDLAALAKIGIPVLVVTGAWHPAFEAIGDVLTEQLQAERLVLPGEGHGPHHVDAGAPLNARLRLLWAAGAARQME